MPDTLPRPDVSIANGPDGKERLVISRDDRSRSYPIDGANEGQRIRGVVEKIIADHNTAEWIP